MSAPLPPRAHTVLRVDACAAGAAGIVVLALHGWLSALHAFPRALVIFLGVTNLIYASYSGCLAVLAARHTTPSRRAIALLVAGNLVWTAVCCGLLVTRWPSASPFGLAHVAFEGAFVGVLAWLESRWVLPFARSST